MALRMVKKAGARGRTRWVGFTATAFALIALTALVFPKIAQAWVSDNVLSQNTVQGVSPNGTTIDLFDYWTTSDGSENDSYNYNGGINNGHQLKFNTGTPQSASDVINSWTGAGNGPRTGIVENTLTDGYPTIAAGIISGWVNLNNNNNGRGGSQTLTEESLAYLFDNSTQDGKQGYYDVQGLLQVDSDGYYYYNASSAQTTDAGGSFQSANYATFDSGTNSFTLYDTWAVANEGTNSPDGQFFPFSDANDVFNSYDGRLTADTDIKASSNDLNHYFGMHMSTQFVQQYGGHTEENGDIVTYEFSGDDDVWIYIDDVLVADLGGIHDAASVTIDFSTGEIHVYDVTGTDVTPSNMNTLRECYETAGAANTVEWSNNGNTFADNTYHTLDFFYLERGNSDSNMSLKYNLVNIPETDISKVDQEGNYVAGAEFAVYNTTDGKTTTSENLICNATTESDGTVTLLDADGYPITLKSLYEEDGVRNITLVETKTPDGYRSVSEVPLYIQRYENTPNGDPVYLLLSSDPWTTGAYAQPKVTASAENDVKITTNSGEQTLTSEQKQDGVMFIVIEKKVNGDWYPVTGNALDGWTVYDDNTTASIAQAGKETNAIFTISTSGAYEAEVENLPGRIQDYEYFAGESGTYRAAYYYTSASTLDNANESNTFPISNSGEFYREFSARVYVSNIVNRVLVQKTDESGNAVDGATMALFSADDVDVAEDGTATLKQGVTAEDALQTATTRTLTEEADSIDLAGAAAFTGLEPGTYYVAELSAPDGYAVNGTLAKIVVDGTGVYADAGTEGDGVTVTRGVGRIVRSMLQFATADDVDATLRNIVATPQLGTQGSDGTLSWQDNEGAQVQHLQYDDDGNSVLDYALQDGSKAYTVDEGMPRLTVKQCSTHLSEPRQDVSSYDLTNLFTGVTIVHIADEQVGGLDVTKQVEGDGADAGATFSFTVTFTHAATEGASATPLTQDEADAAGMQLAIGDGAATDVTVGEDGTVTFMLADGQTAHFTNVPAGVTYTVEEAAASGFETSYDSAATGPIEFNKTASTTVTNTVRPEAVLDGESALAVTKTVNTPTERDFSFELSLTSAKDSAGSDLSGSVFETDENGDLVAFNGMTATIDGSFTEGDGLSQTARFGKLVFTDPGTYTFSVSEVVPEATDGWTYQTTPQTVTVTVKDDFTVDVAYEGDATSAAFTNTYGATGELPMDGSGSIALSKTLTGRDWVEGDSFTFTLTGKNVTSGAAEDAGFTLPDTTEVTVGYDDAVVAAGDGNPTDGVAVGFGFDAITFTQAGTYEFTVTEGTIDEAGVSNTSGMSVTYRVVVTDATQDGKLEVGTPEVVSESGTGAFKNAYDPTAATGSLSATKTLNGESEGVEAGAFEFVISAVDGAPLPSAATDADGDGVYTVTNGTDGTIDFGQFGFDAEGTYVYHVSELNAGQQGYTYDTAEYTVAFVVTDDPETGSLVAARTIYQGSSTSGSVVDSITFANSYKPESVTTPADATFSGTKSVTEEHGSFTMEDGQFSFTMVSTSTPQGVTAPEPSNGSTVRNAADGAFDFGTLTFTEPGEYTYTVSEVAPVQGVDGITYSTERYTLYFKVVDNGGQLHIEEQGITDTAGEEVDTGELNFTNIYNDGKVSYQLAGSKVLETNGYAGETLADGEYTFALYEVGADGSETKIEEVSNGAPNGNTASFQFSPITYTEAGTHTFKVYELGTDGQPGTGGTDADNVSYSTAVYTVTVTVTQSNDGRGLSASAQVTDAEGATASDVLFTNTYTPKGVVVGPSGSAQIGGTKTLAVSDGADRALAEGEFTFVLLDANGDEVGRVANAADGSFVFDGLTFDAAGTYSYTVAEVSGSAGGIGYDDSLFAVTVEVTEDTDANALVADVSYAKDGATVDAISFENTYTAASTTASIGAFKQLSGGTLADGQFTFELTGSEDAPMPEGAQDGVATTTNAADGTVSFGDITFDAVGEYDYTITEANDGQDGISYDENATRAVHVSVTDDGEGHLVAEVTYDDAGAVFVNAVNEDGGTGDTGGDTGDSGTPADGGLMQTGDNSVVSIAVALVAGLACVAAGTVLKGKRGNRKA